MESSTITDKELARLGERLLIYGTTADGREVTVSTRPFNVIMTVGPVGSYGYDNQWCYAHVSEAVQAFADWNPLEQNEPEGWFRNPSTGRRRPDGDKSKEYVNF